MKNVDMEKMKNNNRHTQAKKRFRQFLEAAKVPPQMS